MTDEVSPNEARKWLHVSVKVCDDDLLDFLDHLRRVANSSKTKNPGMAKVYNHFHDAVTLSMKLRKAKYG